MSFSDFTLVVVVVVLYFARIFLFQLFRLLAEKRKLSLPLSLSLYLSLLLSHCSFIPGLRVKTFSRDSRGKLLATKVRVPGGERGRGGVDGWCTIPIP